MLVILNSGEHNRSWKSRSALGSNDQPIFTIQVILSLFIVVSKHDLFSLAWETGDSLRAGSMHLGEIGGWNVNRFGMQNIPQGGCILFLCPVHDTGLRSTITPSGSKQLTCFKTSSILPFIHRHHCILLFALSFIILNTLFSSRVKTL